MIKIFTHILVFVVLMASGISDGRKANEAYEKGNYAEAEALYLKAIEENPEDARLYFNLGNAQAKQGKTEEAIESYMEAKALAKDPADKAGAEYNIGTLMAQTSQWKPATAHFKKALKLNPGDPDAKHNYELALAKQQEEQEEQQQQQENQPPPKPSEYAKAMKKRAEKLVAQRKYAEAYDLMQQALAADNTVRAFNSFIERTKNVAEINSN